MHLLFLSKFFSRLPIPSHPPSPPTSTTPLLFFSFSNLQDQDVPTIALASPMQCLHKKISRPLAISIVVDSDPWLALLAYHHHCHCCCSSSLALQILGLSQLVLVRWHLELRLYNFICFFIVFIINYYLWVACYYQKEDIELYATWGLQCICAMTFVQFKKSFMI
jgi:hypothetical protein